MSEAKRKDSNTRKDSGSNDGTERLVVHADDPSPTQLEPVYISLNLPKLAFKQDVGGETAVPANQ